MISEIIKIILSETTEETKNEVAEYAKELVNNKQ